MFQLESFLSPLYLYVAGGLVELYFLLINFDNILIDDSLHLIFLKLAVVDNISIDDISKILLLVFEPEWDMFVVVYIILIVG